MSRTSSGSGKTAPRQDRQGAAIGPEEDLTAIRRRDQQGHRRQELERTQLDWLLARLNEAGDRPVIIVLHHNITKFHTQNDSIILKDSADFAGVVASHPEVRQVISGHVHMTTAGTYKGIPFCTLAGCHSSIEPTLESLSGPLPAPARRREGPGELAVVLSDEESTVVHMEKFLDRHLVMAQEHFVRT